VHLDLLNAVDPAAPSAVLVVPLQAPAARLAMEDGWFDGPLPVVQAVNPTSRGRGLHASTDAPARRTLIAPRQATALYGSGHDVRSLTRRRSYVGRVDLDGTIEAVAFEIWHGRPLSQMKSHWAGFLVVHVVGADDLATHLDAVAAMHARGVSLENPAWTAISKLLPLGFELVADSKSRVLHHLVNPDDPLVAAYAAISAVPSARLPDLNARARRHEWTIERPDWNALVLRDGAAVVSLQTSQEDFSQTSRVLTHTVYLDALLFALIQRDLVDESGARAVTATLDSPDELVALEAAHFELKRGYWRTSLTDKRTAPTDDILRAFQDQLLTARDVAEVDERVKDGARLANSLQTARVEAAQSRLNQLVQNVTVVFGALGLAFGAAAVWAEPSFELLLWALVAGGIGMALAFTVLWLWRHKPESERVPPSAAE
jgi:hypothetical protein